MIKYLYYKWLNKRQSLIDNIILETERIYGEELDPLRSVVMNHELRNQTKRTLIAELRSLRQIK